MIRKLIFGATLACVLVAAPSALAGNVPRATLVKKADAICTADGATYKRIKNKPNLEKIWSWSPKQLKATGPYWDAVLALTKSETTRIFALGTPSEPAARKAWSHWHTLATTYEIPQLTSITAAAKRGDLKTIAKAFSSEASEKKDDEGAQVLKSLGLKVCEL